MDSRHALVVDDDRDIVRLVQSYLEEQGFTVTTAGSGREALDQIQQNQPDLLVMDVTMPELDGLECLRQLRADAATATLPVILLTARDELPDMIEGWKAGVDYYMTKPFEKQTLFNCLQHLWNGPADPGTLDG